MNNHKPKYIELIVDHDGDGFRYLRPTVGEHLTEELTRSGFLSGEAVAILRLSELHRLIGIVNILSNLKITDEV